MHCNKKILFIALIAFIVVSAVACYPKTEELVVAAPAKRDSPLEIGELARSSSIVVIGTVLEEKGNDDFLSPYYIQIDKELRGKYPYDEMLFFENGRLEVGSQYLLFLNMYDNPFWPRQMLLSVDPDAVLKVEKDVLITDELFTELNGMSLDDCLKAINSNTNEQSEKQPDVIETLEPKLLLEASDYIFTGIVESVTYHTAIGGGFAQIKVEKYFKGDDFSSATLSIVVPRGVEEGKAYLFFRNDGIESIPVRNGSVIEIGTVQYDEFLSIF